MATRSTKQRKKIWVRIVAPSILNETLIGESNVYEVDSVVGKHVKVNLMSLSGDPKHQNINLSFLVDRISGDLGKTTPLEYLIVPSTIKRMVRRKRDRMDLSFLIKTKDGCVVRIKPLVLTRNNAKGSVLTTMRGMIRDYYEREAVKFTFEQLFGAVVFRKIQMGLKDILKKIYPINISEVRQLTLVSGKPELSAMKTAPKDAPKKEVRPAAKKEAPKAEAKKEEPEDEKPAEKKKEAPKEEKAGVKKENPEEEKPKKKAKKKAVKVEEKKESEEKV
ncbi:MAG: hypothetical protein ABIH34_01110 [Nanoarchaeota archaeon]